VLDGEAALEWDAEPYSMRVGGATLVVEPEPAIPAPVIATDEPAGAPALR